MSEKEDILDARYVDLLKQHGVNLAGKKILDVGTCTASFMMLAKQHGAEVWGVDHMPEAKASAQKRNTEKGSPLSTDDMAHYLEMSFSEMLDKRPELKGTFDVINCTAVSAYMNMREMRNFAHVAHQLLKPDGCLLFQLPWEINTQAFQAGQSEADCAKAMVAGYREKVTLMERKEAGRVTRDEHNKVKRGFGLTNDFQDSYCKLLKLYFADTDKNEVEDAGSPLMFAQRPRAHIPPVKDIAVDFPKGKVTFNGKAKLLWQQIQANENQTRPDQTRPEETIPAKKHNKLAELLATPPTATPWMEKPGFGGFGGSGFGEKS